MAIFTNSEMEALENFLVLFLRKIVEDFTEEEVRKHVMSDPDFQDVRLLEGIRELLDCASKFESFDDSFRRKLHIMLGQDPDIMIVRGR